MNYEIIFQRILWFLALIFDSAWLYLCLITPSMGIALLFGSRILLDVSALVISFKSKPTPEQNLTLAAVWIWLLAVVGLMAGNVFLFLVCSMGSLMLYYASIQSVKKR